MHLKNLVYRLRLLHNRISDYINIENTLRGDIPNTMKCIDFIKGAYNIGLRRIYVIHRRVGKLVEYDYS